MDRLGEVGGVVRGSPFLLAVLDAWGFTWMYRLSSGWKVGKYYWI